MATNSNALASVLAPVKGEDLATRKARLDAAWHAGTKADRLALMAANGLRALRDGKGYGRAAVAKALGLTPAEWWVAEFVLPAGSPACVAMAKRVAALPQRTKGKSSLPPIVAKAKPAPKAKAKPAADQVATA